MFLDNEFYLMNKDKKILKFLCDSTPLGISLEELEIYSDRKPYGYSSIGDWIEKRQAPKHRQYIEELLRMCGCYDLDGYIRVTHALSLNDTFWVKPTQSILLWKDVSLYENHFDETIAKIAFEGGLYGREFTTTSPEFGTSGSFAKCWVKEDNSIFLLKRGSEGARNAGLEPYSEMYASQVAKIICPEVVDYKVVKYHDKLASKCKLFTSEKEGFVPIAKFFGRRVNVIDILKQFENYGCADEFRRMIVLDALIINTDRHMGNYGFIMNNETMEIKRMAPMFDHNLSLLPYAEEDDFKNIKQYLSSRPTQIGEDFNDIAHALLTPEIKSDLNNMRGFTFDIKSDFQLPCHRVKNLEQLIQNQIDGITHGIRLYVPENTAEILKQRTLDTTEKSAEDEIEI